MVHWLEMRVACPASLLLLLPEDPTPLVHLCRKLRKRDAQGRFGDARPRLQPKVVEEDNWTDFTRPEKQHFATPLSSGGAGPLSIYIIWHRHEYYDVVPLP